MRAGKKVVIQRQNELLDAQRAPSVCRRLRSRISGVRG